MAFISITRLRIRSWRYSPGFLWDAGRSARQAKSADGNLGVATLRDAGSVFWTRTVWTSEEAMRAFLLAGAHGAAMRKLMEWCDEAAVCHWTQELDQDSAVTPDWQKAYGELLRIGRPSKVNRPSKRHLAHHFPAPEDGPGREFVWK
jgi:hypothetical protein